MVQPKDTFMKNFTPLFIISLLLISTSTQAQIEFYITPSVYTETYVPLENAINLTLDLPGWSQDSIQFELPAPINLATGFVELTHLQIKPGNSLARFTSSNPFYFAEIIAIPFDGLLLDPLNDPVNTDNGDILYKYENDISTIEFRNVATSIEPMLGPLDNLISRFNFQIEINHFTERVRYRFGPSEIAEDLQNAFDSLITIPSAIIINITDLYPYSNIVLPTGSPDNPVFKTFYDFSEIDPDSMSYLAGFPQNGTVYEFVMEHVFINSTDDIHSSGFKVFPNPATEMIHISMNPTFIPEYSSTISIYDLTGKEMIQTAFDADLSLDVSHLPAGMYFIGLQAEGQTYTQQWIKY